MSLVARWVWQAVRAGTQGQTGVRGEQWCDINHRARSQQSDAGRSNSPLNRCYMDARVWTRDRWPSVRRLVREM